MKVLVMYDSRTGNTRKLAEAVAGGVLRVKGIECVLKAVSEIAEEDFTAADGIIAGWPAYFGTMAAGLKDVFDRFVRLRRVMEGKVGAAFATAGDFSGGQESTVLSILQAFLLYGMIAVGPPLDAAGHYGISCTGAPDEQTARSAAELGRRVASVVQKLKTQRQP